MDNKKIATKLVDILKNMASVPKKGYNKNQNYYYMREVDVLEALKEELVKNRIILLTSSRLVEVRDKPKIDKNDNRVTEFVTTVETTHTFIDSDSGEQLTINSVGQGYDSLDKGASKAITASVKYALLKTFMISDEGADIENDGESKQPPVATPKTFTTPKVTPSGNKVETVAQDNGSVSTTIAGPNVAEPVKTAVSFPKPKDSTAAGATPAAPVFKKRTAEPKFP